MENAIRTSMYITVVVLLVSLCIGIFQADYVFLNCYKMALSFCTVGDYWTDNTAMPVVSLHKQYLGVDVKENCIRFCFS